MIHRPNFINTKQYNYFPTISVHVITEPPPPCETISRDDVCGARLVVHKVHVSPRRS